MFLVLHSMILSVHDILCTKKEHNLEFLFWESRYCGVLHSKDTFFGALNDNLW